MSPDRPAAAMSSPLAAVNRFPRVRLGHAPTPLDPAPQLGATLGIELWIKRDDCTGLAFGGNKVRQLEFHLGDAQARGADTVLVTGAVQSNLARLAAAGARRLGMDADVQLEERVADAGVLVGLRALGEAAPVYGICVRRDARRQGDRVAKVATELAGLIERPAAFDAGGVEVSDAVHAPGYGRLNDAVREAMAMAARHEALLLDPVYTGKAMAGLVAHVRAGRIAAGSRVLFLHTGGLPALFAYADKLGSWLTKAPWAPPR